MPQLDSWTYFGQVVWVCSALFVVYYGSKGILLPSIATSLKSPIKLQKVLGNQSSSMGDELSYTKSV